MAEQNTQAVVLKQPNGEKLQLELKITQVADDTTAMKSFEKGADISIASFDYATGIAVFLALCATGLAYWFGVRSFKLTKQSFELTLKQIASSVEQTLNSNKELYQSQQDLQLMQIKATHRQEWIDKVRAIFSEILIVRSQLYILIPNNNSQNIKMRISSKIEEFRSLRNKIILYLNPSENLSEAILSEINRIDDLVTKFYNKTLVEGEIDKLLEIVISKKLVDNMQELLKKEWERVKKGE